MKSSVLLNEGQGNFVYAVYSFMVALGVAFFYFYEKLIKSAVHKKTVFLIVFCTAAVFLVTLALCANVALFWVSVVGLFLTAGFNTGAVSLLLYRIYRQRGPVGKVLALASLIGFALHYAFGLGIWNGGNAPALLAATLPAVACLTLLYLKYPAHMMEAGAGKAWMQPDRKEKYTLFLCVTGVIIAILSFLIGVGDSLAAQRLAFHMGGDSFFYPLLFHMPGQVLACLIVDIRKGKYVSIATLASVILMIPTVLFLESPEEFYMNSGISYFLGGFFMVFIMTGFVSVAHRAKNKLLIVCLAGMVYPVFCGVGALLSAHIAFDMDDYAVLTGLSVLIVLLAVAAWMQQPGSGASTGLPAGGAGPDEQQMEALRLTAREREVLPYLLGHMTADEIAGLLHISSNTLKTHTRNILGKADVPTRRELRKLFSQ